MPEPARQPQTIDGFCEHFEIDRSVLSEFQSRDEYTDDLYRAAISWGKSKVPELLHTLYEKYKTSKNPNDLRMYKELINLDKAAMSNKETDAERDRKGILRELFTTSQRTT